AAGVVQRGGRQADRDTGGTAQMQSEGVVQDQCEAQAAAIVLDEVNRAAIRAGRLLGCHEDALDKPRRVRLAGDEPREVEELWEAITGVPGSHGVSIRQAGAGAPAGCRPCRDVPICRASY